eukprot:scaffold5584_cov110-Isochrysis_galbana.AAC.3
MASSCRSRCCRWATRVRQRGPLTKAPSSRASVSLMSAPAGGVSLSSTPLATAHSAQHACGCERGASLELTATRWQADAPKARPTSCSTCFPSCASRTAAAASSSRRKQRARDGSQRPSRSTGGMPDAYSPLKALTNCGCETAPMKRQATGCDASAARIGPSHGAIAADRGASGCAASKRDMSSLVRLSRGVHQDPRVLNHCKGFEQLRRTQAAPLQHSVRLGRGHDHDNGRHIRSRVVHARAGAPSDARAAAPVENRK